MKMFNISLHLGLALALTISAVGCGKSQDSTNTPVNNPVVTTAGVTPLPGVSGVPAGALPVGCYMNGSSQCAPCPTGYTSNGSYCTSTGGNTGGTYGCGYGYFYNGYTCQQIGYYPSGYGCPYGTSWSNYYYACVGAGSQLPNANCKVKSYLGGVIQTYVCY